LLRSLDGYSHAVAATLWISVVAFLVGCGDGPQAATEGQRPRLPAGRGDTPKPPVRAHTARQCLAVWNADEAIGSTYQVSHTDFMSALAKAGQTPARVASEKHNCYVTAPVGHRRIAWFAAWDGYAP
jgi:hypothetical protein